MIIQGHWQNLIFVSLTIIEKMWLEMLTVTLTQTENYTPIPFKGCRMFKQILTIGIKNKY